MDEDRSREGRAAAESALVRVALAYGDVPPFVLLGGLVPALLCPEAAVQHAGTTDIDVHVSLEAHAGLDQDMPRLERALVAAGFRVDKERVWRWTTSTEIGTLAEVKFEILTDSETGPANVTFKFDSCSALGAANLRGTGYAALDFSTTPLTASVGGAHQTVRINVTGIAGFLMAKLAAAHGRRKSKDWYDIAYVLLNNSHGTPDDVAEIVSETFPGAFGSEAGTWLRDLKANFADNYSQGCEAYADQTILDLPGEDPETLRSDSRLAVGQFAAHFIG